MTDVREKPQFHLFQILLLFPCIFLPLFHHFGFFLSDIQPEKIENQTSESQYIKSHGIISSPERRFHHNGQPCRFFTPYLISIGGIHFKFVFSGTQPRIDSPPQTCRITLHPALVKILKTVLIISMGRICIIQAREFQRNKILIVSKYDFTSPVQRLF